MHYSKRIKGCSKYSNHFINFKDIVNLFKKKGLDTFRQHICIFKVRRYKEESVLVQLFSDRLLIFVSDFCRKKRTFVAVFRRLGVTAGCRLALVDPPTQPRDKNPVTECF